MALDKYLPIFRYCICVIWFHSTLSYLASAAVMLMQLASHWSLITVIIPHYEMWHKHNIAPGQNNFLWYKKLSMCASWIHFLCVNDLGSTGNCVEVSLESLRTLLERKSVTWLLYALAWLHHVMPYIYKSREYMMWLRKGVTWKRDAIHT